MSRNESKVPSEAAGSLFDVSLFLSLNVMFSPVGSMSPLPEPIPSSKNRASRSWKAQSMTAIKKLKKYSERLFRPDHMDFEFAFWQMIYLFVNPKKVFIQSQYRKQIKDQFARDDPAFLVLLSVWFVISASGLALVLHLPFTAFLKFIVWIVLIDCVLVGVVVATLFWFVTNKYMRTGTSVEDVEWGFAFDVHLNAFFPPVVILHVFQLFFFNLFIVHDYFFARFLGNSLWLLACSYYVFITFLGYSSVPWLHRTKWILYPIVPLVLIYVVTLISGVNICRIIMDFYHYRVY